MTKKELKEEARARLLQWAQIAFNDESIPEELVAEMDKQFERIEHLFGYVKGSWNRGA